MGWTILEEEWWWCVRDEEDYIGIGCTLKVKRCENVDRFVNLVDSVNRDKVVVLYSKFVEKLYSFNKTIVFSVI